MTFVKHFVAIGWFASLMSCEAFMVKPRSMNPVRTELHLKKTGMSHMSTSSYCFPHKMLFSHSIALFYCYSPLHFSQSLRSSLLSIIRLIHNLQMKIIYHTMTTMHSIAASFILSVKKRKRTILGTRGFFSHRLPKIPILAETLRNVLLLTQRRS